MSPIALAERASDPLPSPSAGGGQRRVLAGPAIRAVAWVVVAVVAYRFTLSTFLGTLRLDTPLAYLPLLPVLGLVTAVMTLRRRPEDDPEREDRAVDLLLGIPLLLAALSLVTVIPLVWSTYYWTDRPDVLSLGLFVIGGLVVLNGIPWCWRLRGSLLFLVLMWPGLYARPLPGLLRSLTSATNGALGFLVQHLPIAAASSPDNSLVTLHPGRAEALQVSVGSVCAGGNGLFAFLLLGGGLLFSLRGSGRRKVAWLVTGLVLTFAANLARLVAILTLAAAGHSSFALGGFHDTIGIVLFAVTTTVALVLLPRFGLSFRGAAQAVVGWRSRGPGRSRRAPRAFTVATLAVVAALAGLTNGSLGQYAAWADGTGAPTVLPFATNSAAPTGWYVQHLANFGWGEQYFGPGSTFDRHAVIVDGRTVTADVVRTPDSATLAAYNLQNCFLFHDYDIRSARRVDLGRGVTGLVLDYYNPRSGKRWATVSWAWPVRYKGGTAYERVVLTSEPIRGSDEAAGVRPRNTVRTPLLWLLNLLGRDDKGEDVATYGTANDHLVAMAGDLVAFTVANGSNAPVPAPRPPSPVGDFQSPPLGRAGLRS